MSSSVELIFGVGAVLQGVLIAAWRARAFGAVHAAAPPAGDGRRLTERTSPSSRPASWAREHRLGIALMSAGHLGGGPYLMIVG